METLVAARDHAVQMIDTSIVRAHQHTACIARNKKQSMGRSRGGPTCKISCGGRYQRIAESKRRLGVAILRQQA